MILFSIGLPSRLARWCDAVLLQLAARSGAPAHINWPSIEQMLGFEIVPPALDELGRFMIGTQCRHLVVGARQPDERLLRALAANHTPFVLALDDPADAVADIIAGTGASPKHAVRAVANSCAMISAFERMPAALVMHGNKVRADPPAAVAAIAGHFGLPIDLAGEAFDVPELDPNGALDGVAPDVARMIEGALSPYRQLFSADHLSEITWRRDLFFVADDASRSPTEPIEISGGSRILIYGPYILLPPGSWSAQIVLGFSPEAATASYLVDIFAGSQLASTTFQPGGRSIYNASLTFSLPHNLRDGVEVRVTVLDNDAKGHLAFGQVILNPLAAQPRDQSPADPEFMHVLTI